MFTVPKFTFIINNHACYVLAWIKTTDQPYPA